MAAVRSARSCSFRVLTGVHASDRRPYAAVGERAGLGWRWARRRPGAATVAYAAGRRAPPLDAARGDRCRCWPPGPRPLRVLHISDLHLTPGQDSKQRWVAALAALEPDLVVNTGDNLAHPRAVPGGARRARARCWTGPACSCSAATTTSARHPEEPGRATWCKVERRIQGEPLPWRDLRAALLERGWSDVTHARAATGRRRRRPWPSPASTTRTSAWTATTGSPAAPCGQPGLRLGLTHSPEPRVLDRFAADGYDLVLAGHTHGGQLRVPGVGALVTNCGLDRSRARGASRAGARTCWLHVSAGLGTSPFAPVRFACPPGGQPADPGPAAGRGRPTRAATPASAAVDVG